MNETFQQYRRRLLGYVGRRDPMTVLESTPRRLAELVRGVPKRRLLQRPAPRKWSVGEILAHLADSEVIVGWRFRLALVRSGIVIQAFDQDALARAGHYRQMDPDRSLETYSVLRAHNVAMLRSLTTPQWNRYGMHEERGKESVRFMARLSAGHDLNHFMQVERIVKSGR